MKDTDNGNLNLADLIGKDVMVTTSDRGVFAGRLVQYECGRAVIRGCRILIFRVRDQHGVFALATEGPSNSCRVGPAVDTLLVEKVNSVALLTEPARLAWEEEPWAV